MSSVRQIQYWQQQMKVNYGYCPSIYQHLHDRLNIDKSKKDKTIYVSLMCDDVKLQSGIYTNIKTGEVVGFTSTDDDFFLSKNRYVA